MKMKHFFRMTIFAVAGLLAFVACSKDEYANELENPGVVYQDSPEADSDPCNSVSGKHGSIDMIISPSDIHLTDANNVEIDLGDEVPVELANLFSNMISEIKMSMK